MASLGAIAFLFVALIAGALAHLTSDWLGYAFAIAFLALGAFLLTRRMR